MDGTIRSTLRGMYDMQKLRIQAGNRIIANFRSKLGIEAGESDIESDKAAQDLLAALREEYQLLTDGVSRITRRINLEDGKYIDTHTEIRLIQQYEKLADAERSAEIALEDLLEEQPIWTEFLVDVDGCATKMASVLISEIDIAKAKYPSSLWKYSGLDVVHGEGRSRKKEHLEEVEYENKNGKMDTRKGLTYNPFLKTKIRGVLAENFIRQNEQYKQIYDDKKHYYMTRGFCNGTHSEQGKAVWMPSGQKTKQPQDYCTKGHAHNMAARYMVKMFLKDLYVEWRTLEGLPVSDTYHEAKMGHTHMA